jgi:hypothetical protein
LLRHPLICGDDVIERIGDLARKSKFVGHSRAEKSPPRTA